MCASLWFIYLTSLLVDVKMGRGGDAGPSGHDGSVKALRVVASMGHSHTVEHSRTGRHASILSHRLNSPLKVLW